MAGFSVITELTSQSVNKELNFYLELQKNYKNKSTYKNTNRTPNKKNKIYFCKKYSWNQGCPQD